MLSEDSNKILSLTKDIQWPDCEMDSERIKSPTLELLVLRNRGHQEPVPGELVIPFKTIGRWIISEGTSTLW